MSNRSRQRSQRRARIFMTVFAILLILSMAVSLLGNFAISAPVTSNQPQAQPTVIVITPAP